MKIIKLSQNKTLKKDLGNFGTFVNISEYPSLHQWIAIKAIIKVKMLHIKSLVTPIIQISFK